MDKLIKPQKQCYTGEDAQVLAYARDCEIAWGVRTCVGFTTIGYVVTGSPWGAVAGALLALAYIVSMASYNGHI